MKQLLNGFWAIASKELTHIRRDRTTLMFAIIVPMVQLLLFGFAIDYDVRYIRTVVVDFDQSRESRAYIAGISATHYLEVIRHLNSPEQARMMMLRGEARVAIIIPSGYARLDAGGAAPVVRVLLDGSDSQVALPARNALARLPRPGPGVPDVRFDVLYNPQMRSQVYTIPGLVGVILQLVTVSLTSFSLVREREQGTLDQLMVSPVGRLGLILGKLAPYAVLAMFELATVLAAASLIFNVHVAGSLLLLVCLALPFVLAALSIGLLISTVAQTQGQALQFTLLTTLPSILLSGYIAPRETLPGPLYILSSCIPVTHFIQIARGVMVRGAGMAQLFAPVGSLCAITVTLLTLATLRFRKNVG